MRWLILAAAALAGALVGTSGSPAPVRAEEAGCITLRGEVLCPRDETAQRVPVAVNAIIAGPRAQTHDGPLFGLQSQDFVAFEDIPFAAPPIGPRRWRTPEPATRWNGERDARAYG